MGGTILHPQFTFANGQVDPSLYQRGDLKAYYQGAKTIENCFCKITGGVKKRYGSEFIESPEKCINAYPAAGNFTIPNLATGTAANLVDGNRSTEITTTNVTTTNFVVFQYDLGSSQNIQYVDIWDAEIYGWTGAAADRWKLEISIDDVTYTEISSAKAYKTSGQAQDLSYLINNTATRYIKFSVLIAYAAYPVKISQVLICSNNGTNSNIRFKEVYINKYGESYNKPILIIFGSYHAHLYYTIDDKTVFMNSIWTGIKEDYNDQISLTIKENGTIIVTESSFNPKEIRFQYAYDGIAGVASFRTTAISLLNIPRYEFAVNDVTTVNTLTPSATTGYIDCTASGASFTATDVNVKIDITPIGRIRITEYVSTTVVRGYVEEKLQNTAAIAATKWTIERGWEAILSSTKGWPICSAFFNGRLYFGATKKLPSLLLASTIEDNYDFDIGDQSDSDGFWRLLKSSSNITSLCGQKTLEIYTGNSVNTISSSTTTPTTVTTSKTSPVGIYNRLDAAEIQSTGSVYINKQANAIYRMIYSDDVLSYKADNISDIAGGLISLPEEETFNHSFDVWKGDSTIRNDVIVFIDSDKNFILGSLFLEENVKAFSKGTISDINAAGARSKVDVLHLAAISNGMPMLVKRHDDRYQVCLMKSNHQLDISLFPTIVGTVVSGLEHLDGDTVDVIADGEYLGEFDVAGNQIDLGAEYTTVEVGFGVWPIVETLPIEDIEQVGSSIGKSKNISEVYINSERLTNLYINDNMFLDTNENNATIEPVVARNIRGWSREKTVKMTQQKPLSFSIKNILVKAEINE